MNEQNIINYYNKFNEDKRLTRRHGIVEFNTTIHYLNNYLKKFNKPKILDVGAGTGKYSIYLDNQGYDVTAIELVKHNLMTLRQNCQVKSYLGNALDLSRFSDNSFDIVLLFGPLYHLITKEEKIKALQEAKRVVKKNGLIFISYYMNDYALIKHGFMNKNIMKSLKDKMIDINYHITPKDTDLYSMVRIEDINEYKDIVKLQREEIVAQDGPSDYIRKYINDLSEEEFKIYLDYVISISNRYELLGASSHILDILRKD